MKNFNMCLKIVNCVYEMKYKLVVFVCLAILLTKVLKKSGKISSESMLPNIELEPEIFWTKFYYILYSISLTCFKYLPNDSHPKYAPTSENY